MNILTILTNKEKEKSILYFKSCTFKLSNLYDMVLTPDSKLQIASKSENISLVEKLIDDVCKQHQVNEDYYGNILIAITEAVNNAISHGNKFDPTKMVEVTFKSSTNTLLTFTVKDEGKGFNPYNLPDPTDPERLEEPHGRGVFLMRNLADKVEFFDEGRAVTMSFNLKNKVD